MIEFEERPYFPDGCAIVFGGTGGLGKSTARLLAYRGTPVVITYFSRKDEAEEIVQQIKGFGQDAIAVQCDQAKPGACEAVTAAALEKFGRIHTVISGAGKVFDTPIIADASAEFFREVVETDVLGFFNLVQATLPALRAGGGGSYVAMITTGVCRTLAGSIYSAVPKASMSKMMQQIAVEEGENNIRANCLGPGVIMSGMVLPMYEKDKAGKALDIAVEKTTLKRPGDAIDIAEAIVFLASERGSYISGQVLSVDGGLAAN